MFIGDKFEVLEALPPYGPMYVFISTDGKPFLTEGLAIRFLKTDGSAWVGYFEPGTGKCSGAFHLIDSIKCLIVSRGQAYTQYPDYTTPSEVFGGGFHEAIETTVGEVILIDDYSITVVYSTGEHWQTELISWFGIRNVSVGNDNIVIGEALDANSEDDWIPFSVDITKQELTGGSYLRTPLHKDKPWWKFWN